MLQLIYVIHKGYCNFAYKYGAINLFYCEYMYWAKYVLFT